MLPADCRVKIEMDDYGEGACGEASESLVRGRTQREPAAVEKEDFSRIVRSAYCPWPPQDGDRHGGAFLTSSPVSIKTPRYTDYSLATPAPHPMSLGPFPCPAQLPQTEYARRLQDRLETAHSFARGQLLSAGVPQGTLRRNQHYLVPLQHNSGVDNADGKRLICTRTSSTSDNITQQRGPRHRECADQVWERDPSQKRCSLALSSMEQIYVRHVELLGYEKRLFPSQHFVYMLMVKWSDLSEKLIYRRYPEVHTFHKTLKEMFPIESGAIEKKDRTIPTLP
ncbi:unnamed protein product, partial [Gadus morhua 'NCC']